MLPVAAAKQLSTSKVMGVHPAMNTPQTPHAGSCHCQSYHYLASCTHGTKLDTSILFCPYAGSVHLGAQRISSVKFCSVLHCRLLLLVLSRAPVEAGPADSLVARYLTVLKAKHSYTS